MQRFINRRSPYLELLMISIVALLLVGGFLIWTGQRESDGQSGAGEDAAGLLDGFEIDGDWSPMTLENEVDGTVYRLDYISRELWRKEIIGSTTNPDVVGIVFIFDGTTYTEYDPQLVGADGEAAILRHEVTDGVVSPERWLWSGLTQDLIAKRFKVESTDRPDLIVMTQTGTVRCPPTPPAVGDTEPPRLPSHLEVCYSRGTYQETERYMLRTDVSPPIPIEMTIAGEGQVTVAVRVQSIRFDPLTDIDVSIPQQPAVATPTT